MGVSRMQGIGAGRLLYLIDSCWRALTARQGGGKRGRETHVGAVPRHPGLGVHAAVLHCSRPILVGAQGAPARRAAVDGPQAHLRASCLLSCHAREPARAPLTPLSQPAQSRGSLSCPPRPPTPLSLPLLCLLFPLPAASLFPLSLPPRSRLVPHQQIYGPRRGAGARRDALCGAARRRGGEAKHHQVTTRGGAREARTRSTGAAKKQACGAGARGVLSLEYPAGEEEQFSG